MDPESQDQQRVAIKFNLDLEKVISGIAFTSGDINLKSEAHLMQLMRTTFRDMVVAKAGPLQYLSTAFPNWGSRYAYAVRLIEHEVTAMITGMNRNATLPIVECGKHIDSRPLIVHIACCGWGQDLLPSR